MHMKARFTLKRNNHIAENQSYRRESSILDEKYYQSYERESNLQIKSEFTLK